MDILKKKKYKRILYSTPTIIILVLLIALVGRATWGVYEKEQETEQKLSLTRQEYGELKQRHQALKKEIDQLETQRGVEEEIREKFGVAKSDEKVVYLLEEKKNSDDSAATSSTPWWRDILNLFGIF